MSPGLLNHSSAARQLAERVRTALGDLAEQLDEDWSAVVLFDALHSVGGRGGLDNWVARSERAFLSAMPRFAIQLKEWLPPVLDFGESMKCFALLGKNEVLWRSGIASTRWLPVHICVACAEVGKLEDASGSLKVMESLAEQPVRQKLLRFIRSRARELERH